MNEDICALYDAMITAEACGDYATASRLSKKIYSLKNFIGKIMKMKYLRGMVKFRRYANTEKGEKRIVATLTTVSVLGLVDLSLLIIGGLLG